MKKIFLFFILSYYTVMAFSQSEETKAKVEYSFAQEAYTNGNFKKCLDHLKKTEELLGATNPKILYYQIKALYNRCEYSKIMDNQLYQQFFNMTSQNTGKKYIEIAKLYDTMDQKLEEEKRAKSKVFLKLGSAFYKQKKYFEAIRQFNQAIALDANNDEAYFLLGKAYIFINDMETALTYISKAFKLNPKKEYHGFIAYLTPDLDEGSPIDYHLYAAIYIEYFLEDFSSIHKDINHFLSYYSNNEKYNNVVAIKKDVIDKDKRCSTTNTYVEKGKNYLRDKDIENAVHWFDKAIETAPEGYYHEGHYYKGCIYLIKNLTNLAKNQFLKYYNTAQKGDGNHNGSNVDFLVRIYFAQGKADSALYILNNARNTEIYNSLACYYALAGDYTNTMKWINKELKETKKDYTTFIPAEVYQMLIDNNKCTEAYNLFTKAQKPTLNSEYVELFIEHGGYDKAIELQYSIATGYHPHYMRNSKRLEYFKLGELLYLHKSNKKEALKYIKKAEAVEALASRPDYVYIKCMAYIYGGKTKNAQKIIDTYKNNPNFNYYMSLISMHAGDKKSAVKWMIAYIDNQKSKYFNYNDLISPYSKYRTLKFYGYEDLLKEPKINKILSDRGIYYNWDIKLNLSTRFYISN